jgi:hypothetical protein
VDLGDGNRIVLQTDVSVSAGKLHPLVECVKPVPGAGYLAYFGFSNTAGTTLTFPQGPSNAFSGGSPDRGQITSFIPGDHAEAFAVSFDGNSLSWTLAGETVTASSGSTPCISLECLP